MSVALVDHGLCNMGSARRALEECGARVRVCVEPDEARDATHIVLPGVGAFAACMARLTARGWNDALRRASREQGTPILGICLGMQLLADHGAEGGSSEGLGLIPGEVVLMTPQNGERLPHVGWNDLVQERDSDLLKGVAAGTDFYFVHSYQLRTEDSADRVASVGYGGGVTAVVQRGTVCGTQFHPEKSSKAGFRVLSNFLAMRG